jgi:phospholipid/cholesterol/gamma-HCH transport system substrate-binding protein
MTGTVASAGSRLLIFVIACLLSLLLLVAIFGQLRFDDGVAYRASFGNVSGLKDGDFVRIAGVEVGKVKSIALQPDASVSVDFSADPSVVLTHGTKATVRYDNLIGGRYLALDEGAGDTATLKAGDTIPLARTAPALDLDALIGGFRPLFRALDPDQVNALSGQLISAFQGQGTTIASFLDQTAAVTGTLADRDKLLGSVITNLNTVLGSLDGQGDKLDSAITSLSQLVHGLAERRTDISAGIGYTNEAARTVADLLTQARPALKAAVAQTDRAAGLVVADHDYFDNILNTLPDKYKVLGRQGLYGNYFSYYFCDILLKLNGKGGQPVYVKVAGQDSGRCAPQ